jgi:CRISPR-associated endoribonuclease Cas6
MIDLSPLTDLPLLPLRITVRALDTIQLPTHWAGTLRGAFGGALYRLVCVYPQRDECPGCPLEETCAYPALFEPRAPAGQRGASGFRDLPRPYVVRAPLGEKIALPGDLFTWEATLIGRAIEHMPYFALAWRAMGHHGVGRDSGRFDLLRVEAVDLEGAAVATVYEGEGNRLSPAAAVIGASEVAAWMAARVTDMEAQLQALEVRFLTPTALKSGGELAPVPHFPILWNSVQRRLSTLRMAHGAGLPAIDFAVSIRLAREVRLEEWNARELTWERYSRRQRQRVPMGGFVGVARYAGDTAPFLPALKLGTLVGVGENATFGQGHYEIMLKDERQGSPPEPERS